MAGLATTQDLSDIWRPFTEADDLGRMQRLLDKAEALLRQQAPGMDERIANFDVDQVYGLDPLVVRQVIASIVKRYLANPTGASASTTGPFSVSFVDRYAGKDGSASIKGTLSVTASDLAALKPSNPAGSIGSIKVKAGLAPVRYFNGYTSEPLEALVDDVDTWPLGAAGQPMLSPDRPE